MDKKLDHLGYVLNAVAQKQQIPLYKNAAPIVTEDQV